MLFQVLRNQLPASLTEPLPWWSRDSSVNVTSSHSSTHHLLFSSPGDEKVYPCPWQVWAIQQDNDGESGNPHWRMTLQPSSDLHKKSKFLLAGEVFPLCWDIFGKNKPKDTV